MKLGPESDQSEILKELSPLDKGEERYLELMHRPQCQRAPLANDHGPCCNAS